MQILAGLHQNSATARVEPLRSFAAAGTGSQEARDITFNIAPRLLIITQGMKVQLLNMVESTFPFPLASLIQDVFAMLLQFGNNLRSRKPSPQEEFSKGPQFGLSIVGTQFSQSLHELFANREYFHSSPFITLIA